MAIVVGTPLAALLIGTETVRADDAPVSDRWLSDWSATVDEAQASQPHWITPLVTTSPRLEQRIRYDQSWQHPGNGASVQNYDGGKGLDIVPTTTNEVIFDLPPYQIRSKVKPAAGFADDPVFLVKQRLLSANEQSGNYIVTAFFGVQAPTGIAAYTNDAWVITSALAGGKGFGDFDIQSTLGVAVPLAHQHTIGTATISNTALQYHVKSIFWPQLEVNATNWSGGLRDGKTQVFLTPGIMFGRFNFGKKLRGTFGVGYQVAVSPHLTEKPALTPIYQHAWLLSARLSF